MSTVKQASGKASLLRAEHVLAISTKTARGADKSEMYAVTKILPAPEVALLAWKLTKADGTVYNVAQFPYGPECDCPHATYRGSKSQSPCKHTLALQAVGLLPKAQEYHRENEEEPPPF